MSPARLALNRLARDLESFLGTADWLGRLIGILRQYTWWKVEHVGGHAGEIEAHEPL
ncbi:MAG: hypothetical protein KIT22_00725 [Verrucomicrobiae bacterium]|nr:hypothetical protein [Verrucomicrobiae bacterium]